MEGGSEMTNNQQLDGKSATLIAQHQQVCEDLRQVDRLVWQIPSLVTLISSTLVVVAFTLMLGYGAALPAREAVLGFALLLLVTMSLVLMRHRYFEAIAVGTLSKLEKTLEVKHVQRTPFPKEFDDFHAGDKMYPKGLLYDATPRSGWADGLGGPKLLRLIMMFFALIIVVLMIYIILLPETIQAPSFNEKTWAWVVFSAFIVAAFVVPIVIWRQENKEIKKEQKEFL